MKSYKHAGYTKARIHSSNSIEETAGYVNLSRLQIQSYFHA